MGVGLDAAGVASAQLEISPLHDCAAGISPELCLLSWQTQGTLDPGDDAVHGYRWVDHAAVRIMPPGGQPEGQLALDTREVRLEHGAFVLLNQSWADLNDSLPATLKGFLTLESRPFNDDPDSWALLLVLHLPMAIDLPTGASVQHPTPVFLSWNTTFTDDSHIYPLGKHGFNTLFQGDDGRIDTDLLITQLTLFAADCSLHGLSPHGCPEMREAVHPLVGDAGSLWMKHAPSVVLGLSLNRTEIDVGSDATLEPRLPPEDPTAFLGDNPSPRVIVLPSSQDGSRVPVPAADAPPEPRRGKEPFVTSDVAPPRAPYRSTVGTEGTFLAPLAVLVALWAFAWALYHRVRRGEALQLGTRRMIHEHIRAHPGIRVGTVARDLGLAYATVRHHVRLLRFLGLVDAEDSGQPRLFVHDARTGRVARAAVVASSTPASKAVLAYLGERGGASFLALRRDLGLPPSTASETATRLERAGLIVKERVGGEVRLRMSKQPPPPPKP